MINTIQQKIQEVFGHYDRHVPGDVINRLFVAIPSDETTLTQEIMGYLLEHNYEALETPKGQSLRERLISTDWRQKEVKMWLPDPERLAVPMAADVSLHPIETPFSQSNKVLIALVMLFVTVLLWLWKGKLTEIDNGSNRTEISEIEQSQGATSVQPVETNSKPTTGQLPKKGALLPVSGVAISKNNNNLTSAIPEAAKPLVSGPSESAEPTTTGQVKPYDSVDNQVGDFGLRAARKGGKWGYVDQKDGWHIDPIYDDVTPFQNGKAAVVLDGQPIVIDRDGARIREEN